MADSIDCSGSTILIVDDNPVSISVVSTILEKAGYSTLTASDGPECIEMTKTLKPDLILLDIMMPDMSGVQVCHALTQDEQTNEIPIIFVTANTDDKVLHQAFEAGGTDYVRKPVSRVELLARIKSVLTNRILLKQLLEEEKLKAVIEMARMVCHEMNQPLQVVLGYCRLLMMDMSEDDQQHSYLSEAVEEIKRMGEMTKKMMRITTYKTRDYFGGRKLVDIDKASRIK